MVRRPPRGHPARGRRRGRVRGSGIDPMHFFSAGAYDGFDDSEAGFSTTYRRLERIAALEAPSPSDEQQQQRQGGAPLPSFGTSKTPFVGGEEEDTTVSDFYDAWLAFATVRSFAWLDLYDTREAPNRQVRRLMEKENKKEREAGRKEYNECVRALAAFVRRRDPRVAEHVQRQRSKREQEAAMAQRKRLENDARQRAVAQRLPRDLLPRRTWPPGGRLRRRADGRRRGGEREGSAARAAARSGPIAASEPRALEVHLERVALLKAELAEDEAGLRPTHPRPGGGDRVQFAELLRQRARRGGRRRRSLASQDPRRYPPAPGDGRARDRRLAGAAGDDADADDAPAGGIEGEGAPAWPRRTSKAGLTDAASVDGDAQESDRTGDASAKPAKPAKSRRAKGARRRQELDGSDGAAAEAQDDDAGDKAQRGSAHDRPIHACAKCRTAFPSRNKLMQHISSSGHALPGVPQPHPQPEHALSRRRAPAVTVALTRLRVTFARAAVRRCTRRPVGARRRSATRAGPGRSRRMRFHAATALVKPTPSNACPSHPRPARTLRASASASALASSPPAAASCSGSRCAARAAPGAPAPRAGCCCCTAGTERVLVPPPRRPARARPGGGRGGRPCPRQQQQRSPPP